MSDAAPRPAAIVLAALGLVASTLMIYAGLVAVGLNLDADAARRRPRKGTADAADVADAG